MSQNYPLGRFHPHGHSGKSVYQLAAAGKAFVGTGYGVFYGLGIAMVGLFFLMVAISSDVESLNILGVIIGIIWIGLKEAGIDLEEVPATLWEIGSDSVPATPPVRRDPTAPLPACDEKLLADMRRYAARMQYAAKLEKWIEVFAYACFLEPLTEEGPWAPYFQCHHSQQPAESVLAKGIRDDHKTLLSKCRSIQRYALKHVSQPELAIVEGVKAVYYPETGELEYRDSTRNGQPVTI